MARGIPWYCSDCLLVSILVFLGYIFEWPEEYLGTAWMYLRVARRIPGYGSDISKSGTRNTLVWLGYILEWPEEHLGMARVYLRVARGIPGYGSDIS